MTGIFQENYRFVRKPAPTGTTDIWRTRAVFVVLEYAGDAWKQAGPDRNRKTRLFAVDAGREPRHLRQQHKDTSRYIITRALVGASFREDGIPRLEGWLRTLVPNQVFVPRPHSLALEGLRQRGASARDEAEREPRYT